MPANWNILHKRLASAVRDEVVLATDSGKELSVADRDAYLIHAYTEYVRLISMHNPSAVGNILSELCRIVEVPAVNGVITMPADFGSFIPDAIGSTVAGVMVTVPSPSDFVKLKTVPTAPMAPTSDNIFLSLQGSSINVLPVDNAGIYIIGYIIKPLDIHTATPESVEDILIQAEHWDTIIELAKAKYFRDKSEFDIAASIKQDAIINAPFRIGEGRATDE